METKEIPVAHAPEAVMKGKTDQKCKFVFFARKSEAASSCSNRNLTLSTPN